MPETTDKPNCWRCGKPLTVGQDAWARTFWVKCIPCGWDGHEMMSEADALAWAAWRASPWRHTESDPPAIGQSVLMSNPVGNEVQAVGAFRAWYGGPSWFWMPIPPLPAKEQAC